MPDLIAYGHGPAKPASAEDIARDTRGFTNPNLHRRIDPHENLSPDEYQAREYMLQISDLNSHRTTTRYFHDEESTTSEIP